MAIEFRPIWLKSSRQPSHLDAMYSRDVERHIPLILPTFISTGTDIGHALLRCGDGSHATREV